MGVSVAFSRGLFGSQKFPFSGPVSSGGVWRSSFWACHISRHRRRSFSSSLPGCIGPAEPVASRLLFPTSQFHSPSDLHHNTRTDEARAIHLVLLFITSCRNTPYRLNGCSPKGYAPAAYFLCWTWRTVWRPLQFGDFRGELTAASWTLCFPLLRSSSPAAV